jgi:hypothetical protein
VAYESLIQNLLKYKPTFLEQILSEFFDENHKFDEKKMQELETISQKANKRFWGSSN